MHEPLEVILVIIGMSFWFLFPIGIFLSVSRIDKSTDQVVRLEHLRHEAEAEEETWERPEKAKKPERPNWRPNVANVHYHRNFGH